MIEAAVLTISDRCARGARTDASGPRLEALLTDAGIRVVETALVPDEPARIAAQVRMWLAQGVPLIVSTGGTGLSPRDVTPETMRSLGGREVPGLAELMRSVGVSFTPFAALSRQVVLQIDRSLVVALPGSTAAVEQGLAAILPVLPHLDEITRSEDFEQTAQPEPCPSRFVEAFISEAPLDVQSILDRLPIEACGAIASFVGVTRSPDGGEEVQSLFYEAWEERAVVTMKAIAASVCARHGARGAILAHRVGVVRGREAAIVAAVSAPHRKEAFRALEELVDRVKAEAEIWKRAETVSGTHWL